MNISRSAQTAILCLAASFLPINSFVAQAATVPAGACLYALDATADRAFQIAGAQSVYTACGAVSESSASDGFEMEGAETLYLQNHSQVSVVGGAQLNGQTELWDTISNKQVQPVKVTSPGDPLASIAAPTSGTVVSKSHASFDMNNKPANNTLSPGVYCGGLTIGNTNGATFTMSPGVYIMAGGGLTLNSQAVVKGTGVTVYNTSSAGWGCSSSYSYTPVTISGQVTATLSAPTSGAFNGILFFGNRTGCATAGSCQDQINGGSTVVFNGALYFKSDQITITGGSSASGYLMLVADKIDINGNSTFGINGDPYDNITVSVSPSTSLLYAGQTQQFTATTNSADTAVTWTISPAGVGTVSASGLYTAPASITTVQTVTVTATSQVDTSKSSTATVTLAVNKTTPTITWATPAAITYGTALSATQLDATSTVAGTFAYTPAAGTVLSAGSQTLSVTFTPTNTTEYNTATASVTLTVNKTAPSISFTVPNQTYGAAPFTVSATSNSPGAFTYSVVSGSATVSGSTVTITGVGTVVLQASQAASGNYTAGTQNASFTVNPPVSVSVTPATATLYSGQTVQLTATVANTSNTAVTWSIAPEGVGTLSASGLYTAPATITAAQTLTVTASSQADPTKSAPATIMLEPAPCTMSAYGNRRTLTIDHTKVPNTDQTDYPMLVTGVYPFLATVANGGQVQNANGYDIVFTSDAAGHNPLDFEIDNYNGANGTAAFWVRIPLLSHTVDTTIYMWYGNSNITASQESIAGVWRNSYLSVYQVVGQSEICGGRIRSQFVA